MKKKLFTSLVLTLILTTISAKSEDLLTDAAHFSNPPKWLTSTRVNRVVSQIQSYLEWSIRRVEVVWYYDQPSFEKAHGLGKAVLAVSLKSENKVLLGPQVTATTFDQIFGHELSHVISYQKYKEAIPKWLEEGLANYVSKSGHVDYPWLAKQSFPTSVRDLTHPFNGQLEHVRYHYAASQALMEMIASKCDLRNLLRLSVGMKLDSYLDTYCRITDLDASFQKWVKDKAKR